MRGGKEVRKMPHSWTLTLINMLLRCAAGRERCTEADEGSPPREQTPTVYCVLLTPHTQNLSSQNTHKDSSCQIVTTDLAYFLEVELWQGMEPVGQLSEVEEFHLKPKVELHTRVNEEAWKGREGK